MDADALIAQLRIDEGVRLKPYTDSVGKTTIGIGRNLTDVGISGDESDALCFNDIKTVVADLDRDLPWWRQQTEDRQQILANMSFNMGIERLLGFHDMLAAVQAGDFGRAADEMLNSLWAKEVHARAQRLAARMRGGSSNVPLAS